MTAAEAAPKLGLAVWTVQRKCALGQIPAVKIHGEWQISEEVIKGYLLVQKMNGANSSARELMKRGMDL